jgi:signal transduction histidine kinase
VIGQSRASIDEGFGRMLLIEAMAIVVLSVLVFFGALVVGGQVARPIEAARQRQLAFTADASHELRTPVAVIEAETDLALSRTRKVAEYRDSLVRVKNESRRLAHMVDSLMWLARFDAAPQMPEFQPIDLQAIAAAAVERFTQMAAKKKISLTVSDPSGQSPIIAAPPEWIERLLGVLIDNACRYTPEGGRVQIAATAQGLSATLVVEDSGPGIPADERTQIFQRFHRALGVSKGTDGAGLGLAIADAVVKSTKGSWEVSESSLGGALVAVSWNRPADGHPIGIKEQQSDQNQHDI